MNYDRIYNNIINRRRQEVFSGYTEKHHILPRSLGGTDTAENLIDLSAREHFLCHYLLVKMQKPDTISYYKMLNAFIMMKAESTGQKRYINNRIYEKLKIQYSKIKSFEQSGSGNSQYGKIWIHHAQTLEKKSVFKTDLDQYLSLGYSIGRSPKKEKIYYYKPPKSSSLVKRIKVTKVDRKLRREQKQNTRKELALYTFNEYKESSFASIRDYAKNSSWGKSHVALTKLWKQYIPEYSERQPTKAYK